VTSTTVSRRRAALRRWLSGLNDLPVWYFMAIFTVSFLVLVRTGIDHFWWGYLVSFGFYTVLTVLGYAIWHERGNRNR